jgi:hypothetical protein
LKVLCDGDAPFPDDTYPKLVAKGSDGRSTWIDVVSGAEAINRKRLSRHFPDDGRRGIQQGIALNFSGPEFLTEITRI